VSTETCERGAAARARTGAGGRSEAARGGLRARPGGSRLIAATAWGAALALALRAGSALVDAAPGEPLVVRWLRTLADHPLRSGAALALVLWAVLPSPIAAPSLRASEGARADRRAHFRDPKSL
jgi:hypothetical protein